MPLFPPRAAAGNGQFTLRELFVLMAVFSGLFALSVPLIPSSIPLLAACGLVTAMRYGLGRWMERRPFVCRLFLLGGSLALGGSFVLPVFTDRILSAYTMEETVVGWQVWLRSIASPVWQVWIRHGRLQPDLIAFACWSPAVGTALALPLAISSNERYHSAPARICGHVSGFFLVAAAGGIVLFGDPDAIQALSVAYYSWLAGLALLWASQPFHRGRWQWFLLAVAVGYLAFGNLSMRFG